MQNILTKTTDVGSATLLENGLLSVFIHTGIELTREKLLQGYEELAEFAGRRYCLLVDRTQSDYSLTYEAMVEGGNHPYVIAQAILLPPYNTHKKMIADTILAFPRKRDIPMRIFTDRNEAIDWLRSKLD